MARKKKRSTSKDDYVAPSKSVGIADILHVSISTLDTGLKLIFLLLIVSVGYFFWRFFGPIIEGLMGMFGTSRKDIPSIFQPKEEDRYDEYGNEKDYGVTAFTYGVLAYFGSMLGLLAFVGFMIYLLAPNLLFSLWDRVKYTFQYARYMLGGPAPDETVETFGTPDTQSIQKAKEGVEKARKLEEEATGLAEKARADPNSMEIANEVSTHVDKLQNEFNEVTNQLQEKVTEINQLKQQIADKNRQMADLRKQLLDRGGDDDEGGLQASEEQDLELLAVENRKLQDKLAAGIQNAELISQQLQSYKETNEQLKNAGNALTTENQELKEQIAQQRRDFDAASKEATNMKKQFESELRKARQERNKFEIIAKQNEAKLRKEEEKVVKLQSELDSIKRMSKEEQEKKGKRIEKLEKDLNVAKEEEERLQNIVDTSKKAYDSMANELEKLKNITEQQKKENKEQEKTLKNLQGIVKQRERQVEDKEGVIEGLKAEINTLRNSSGDNTDRIRELETQLQQENFEKVYIDEERLKAIEAIRELKENRTRLEGIIEQLRNELENKNTITTERLEEARVVQNELYTGYKRARAVTYNFIRSKGRKARRMGYLKIGAEGAKEVALTRLQAAKLAAEKTRRELRGNRFASMEKPQPPPERTWGETFRGFANISPFNPANYNPPNSNQMDTDGK